MRKVRHTENHILGEETSHNNIKGCHQKKKRRIEWHCHSCLTYTLNPPKLIWASFKSYKVVFGRPPPPSRKSLQVRDIRWSFRSIPCTLTELRERERWCPRETVPKFFTKSITCTKIRPKTFLVSQHPHFMIFRSESHSTSRLVSHSFRSVTL